MLRTVYYGPHEIKPWCPGTGYLDKEAKSLKSYRSREPASIWQSLNSKTEDLGEYDLHICKHCFLYSSKHEDIVQHERVCRYRKGHPGKIVHEDSVFRILEVQVQPDSGSRPTEEPSTKSTSKSKPKRSRTATSTGKVESKVESKIEAKKEMSVTPSGQEFNSVKLYLQSLSLFGHLFLDTKSICYCVDAFLFYVAIDKESGMVAGFFSKERHSWHDYNLACIVIFPPWQHHGLGQRLIMFSYLLSRRIKKAGSPEKPLSKHGQLAYNRFWRRKLAEYLCLKKGRNNTAKVTLEKISEDTGIVTTDILETLRFCGALKGSDTIEVAKLEPPN